MSVMNKWTEATAAAREDDEPSVAIVHLSEADVVERLSALVSAGGSHRKAAKALKARGVDVTPLQLEALHEAHSGMYVALAAEQSRAQEEAVAQQLRENVHAANRLTAAYMDRLAEELENGDMPRDIERTIQAVTKVTQVSTDKLLAITGRPVSGQGADPLESARELVRMGILKPVERPIDSTAEEVDA